MTTPGATSQAFPKLDTPLVDMGSGKVTGEHAEIGTGHISRPWYRLLIALWTRTGGANGNVGLPIGVSGVWNGDVGDIPGNCLVEDGTAVSRVQYSQLFAIVKTKFGAGDGSSTFNLPNRIGRFTYGGLVAGSGGGASEVSLTVANLPPHDHPVDDPGHAHIQQVHNGAAGAAGSQGTNAVNDVSIGTTDPAATGITVGDTGGGIPLPILPPYLVGIPIIGAS